MNINSIRVVTVYNRAGSSDRRLEERWINSNATVGSKGVDDGKR